VIKCGRCGQPVSIHPGGKTFRIIEQFKEKDETFGIRSELCDECRRQLIEWLTEGGYNNNKGPALPVRSAVSDILYLKRKLNEIKQFVDSAIPLEL
jgi:hypothetical protein